VTISACQTRGYGRHREARVLAGHLLDGGHIGRFLVLDPVASSSLDLLLG